MSRVYRRHDSESWWVDYADGTGRRVRRSANTTNRQDAEQWLRTLESDAWKVRHGQEPQINNTVELRGLLKTYLHYAQRHCRPRTADSYKRVLSNMLRALPCRTVADLTPRVVYEYQARRTATVSHRTVNIAVTALKTMLNWGVTSGVIAENPIRHVKQLPKRPVKVRRAMCEEEIERLLAVSSPRFRLVFKTLLETGLRFGELASLRWRDLDLTKGAITVRAEVTKTHKGRTIPIPDALRKELAGLRDRSRSVLVFTNSRGGRWRQSLLRGFQYYLKKAKVTRTGLDLHALRHTYATRLRRLGVDVKVIQDLLGHSTWTMTNEVYLHSSHADRRAAVDRLSGAAAWHKAGTVAPDEKAEQPEPPRTRNDASIDGARGL